MNITHICLASFYIDEGSYQENLLPRFHARMGHNVTIIASPDVFSKAGDLICGDAPKIYTNSDGIPVQRIQYKFKFFDRKLKRFINLYKHLDASKPDVIFIHGCQFLDIRKVIKYLEKSPSVRVFVDNHADFSNSAKNFLSKYFLHRILWRFCAQLISPYVEKFYGVLPSRVEFLKNEYKIPISKIDLLLMGADDDLVNKYNKESIYLSTRDRFNVKKNDFLIVTGGKIDSAKRDTLNLMKAVASLENKKVRLLIFGSLAENIKHEFNELLCSNITYIGWVSPEESHVIFNAADLVSFPGRHSVFWEQVVAQKKPLMVKEWPGTDHIDIGGNVIFLPRTDQEEIKKNIIEIIEKKDLFKKLNESAKSSASTQFLYSKIAEKSLNPLS